MRLERNYKWHSDLPAEEFQQMLNQCVHPVERFRLISKVSGAGIVTRVLECPSTDAQFWGRLEQEPFRIVQTLPSINVTPYQPIVHLDINKDEIAQGIIVLRPHAQSTMFATAEYVGAVLCTTAGLISMQENPVGALGILLGISLALFPWWRAQRAFNDEVERCLDALRELPLQWSITEVSALDS